MLPDVWFMALLATAVVWQAFGVLVLAAARVVTKRRRRHV